MIKRKNYLPYKVIDSKFASGGNAKVMLVEDKNKNQYALKSLRVNESRDATKVKRFLNEIKIVEKYQNKIKGIVPIRYKYIPEEFENDFKYSDHFKGLEIWYVMDLAESIENKLGNCDELEIIIDCLISLSETLAELHKHRIVHRDIKPSNIYYYKNKWAFGDFGLVAYPEFDDGLTQINDRIGNYATIAPEMRRVKLAEDARPADVWSLAKTLWMLLTNNWVSCFEGLYNSKDEAISITKYWTNVPIAHLEKILERAIRYEPQHRVDINEFLVLLNEYKVLLNEKKSILSYEELQVLREDSEGGIVYQNSADRTVDTNELIWDFHYKWVSKEIKFIEAGLDDEVSVLKYIKMKLEFYSSNEFIVSPVISHYYNPTMPAIKIFIKYTAKMSKFVTFMICADKKIHEFTHGYTLNCYYDSDENIDFKLVDKIIDKIYEISMKSAGNKNNKNA
ncbi:protein kinase [Paenibacillus sp. 19GGS1-52]|uniref:protein kinase domain-containing protein n=1 Tax=Paenibacillus sp. 19GGS1-52 TaxID=2758563 RepID=UPI001EFBA147|nr:protein kinase [Paenibacillus sp. 19GGS1-52]ULO04825.1 protein kinase [Paenibacillus sp. 19GGS1-52]